MVALAAPTVGEERTPRAGSEPADLNARLGGGAALDPSRRMAGAALDAAVHYCFVGYWHLLHHCPPRREKPRRRLNAETQRAKQAAKQLAALAATFSAHEID